MPEEAGSANQVIAAIASHSSVSTTSPPWPTVATRAIAVLLAVLGSALAFAPEDVPGLTVPGSSVAAPAMEGMGMEE